MGAKRERVGPRLLAAARSGERSRDVHVVLGGTGAVGGTAVLALLAMYEEMFGIVEPEPDDVPVLVATGATPEDIGAFTRRLFRTVESLYGTERLPQRIRRGYLTASGVFVALERFSVTALPGLAGALHVPADEREAAVVSFLSSIGTAPTDPPDAVFDALARTVAGARPFTTFLEAYRAEHLLRLNRTRYRSVTVGIPIPTIVAYHQGDLTRLARHVPGLTPEHVERLKERFVLAIRDDLVQVQAGLADAVLIAHTTGVGGMHDEHPDAPPTIRLGFAHAGRDLAIAAKQRFADELTRLYAEAGLKVLITAAAIGIDEVRVRERIPLHRQIREQLHDADVEVFPGSTGSQPEGSKATRRAGRPVPARQVIRVFPPLTVPFDDPPAGPSRFEAGEDLLPSYAIRSGENGFFSVANADALYRVMRVASASELGLVLATVALLGDDHLSPWFPDNVCYYTETDNARQVLDFLSQPALLATQVSGLEPAALQDLGSAKHQAELHALNLLILLHRLRTLDVDAIDPYVDAEHFDAEAFLVEHSRPLTFEDVAAFEFERLAVDIRVLASANEAWDLAPLTPHREHDLFPRRKAALGRVLERALVAVWTPPALGSPILFEGQDGRTLLRSGYYVAPLDLLVTETDAVTIWLRKAHAESGNPCSFEDYRDYHVTVGGFIDLRPHAVVCSAKSEREDLSGRVARFDDEGTLRDHLWSLEPYSFFATAGLLALTYRLRALYGQLRQAMLELGSLHGFRWQMPRDAGGHILVVPGAVEAARMVAEGLEKATGTERLDGTWGYEPKPPPDRRGRIAGLPTDGS